MRYLFYLFILAACNVYGQQSIPELQARLKTQPDQHKADTYIALSKAYAVSQPDSAVHYCIEGMKLAERLNDKHSQGMLLLEMGRINALNHHPELARKFDNEALSVFRNIQEPEGVALVYDELGLLDGQQQDLSAANHDLGIAMKFYRDTRDSTGILDTYQRLGMVYEGKKETEKALSYYLKALVLYEHKKKKPEAYFVLLDRISQLYLLKGDSRTALKYLENGVHNSLPSDRDTQITLLDAEGKIYEKDGQQGRALTFYKQALDIARKFNRPEEQAKALLDIAGVLKKQDANQSLKDLKRALKIADSLNEPNLEASIYAALAGVYRQQKDYKEAMEALEENHRLVDSLLGTDTIKEIAELDSSYALESSREKIGHLQQVNKQEKTELDLGLAVMIVIIALLVLLWLYLRKVSRLNRELKASNQVKDTLFSIIGHDLKGPAGSAAQLFALMETEDFTEAELKGMISELRKQTEASFELLQTLFEWGRAQLQGIKVSPEAIDPKHIIQKNISLLSRQAVQKSITINDHTPADTRIIADRNHFDFIIRNLLSNAIKFTFEKGLIEVKAEVSGRQITYSVSDTGIGLSTSQQQLFLTGNLKVSFGTGGEKGSGLGLLLIREFLKANKGQIWLESREGEGTTFYFSFPAESDAKP